MNLSYLQAEIEDAGARQAILKERSDLVDTNQTLTMDEKIVLRRYYRGELRSITQQLESLLAKEQALKEVAPQDVV